MRWKSQWIKLLVLAILLIMIGIIETDQELKPLSDTLITSLQEQVDVPKPQSTASGDTYMLVNACQTYSFVAYSFIVLMALYNLVQLRTPMLLTRYPT